MELVFPQLSVFSALYISFPWLHSGPGEASSPYIWDLGPKEQEGGGGIAVMMADLGGRDSDISPRVGDIRGKAGDNWERLEPLTLWSVYLKPTISKFLSSSKKQS